MVKLKEEESSFTYSVEKSACVWHHLNIIIHHWECNYNISEWFICGFHCILIGINDLKHA